MKFLILPACLFLATWSKAQQRLLTEQEFIAAVQKFHPVAKLADVNIQIARAEVRTSRGAFDPQLVRETGRKEFGGLTYYDQQVTELKIPTWYGIDLYAGSETITGNRINPEETNGSINYLGFSVSVLQNLLMDKRRAALLQAKNLQTMSALDKQVVVNDLLREARTAYWSWWEKYYVEQLVKKVLKNAEKRLDLVKMAHTLGDRPAIDTLEAFTQIQVFQIKLTEASADLIRANLQLSAYLWSEDRQQVSLPGTISPQDFEEMKEPTLTELLDATGKHPEFLQYNYKLNGIQIEQKLAFQALLPDIKLKYNQTGYDFSKTINSAWFTNNYRYGISFTMPLRLSEGRGYYQKARLKREYAQLEQANKLVQLVTKVKEYYTEWQQSQRQLSQQEELVLNTARLQNGEEIKFSNGESSLFLINTRELKTIEAEQKVIELKAKNKKAAVALIWSSGIMVQ